MTRTRTLMTSLCIAGLTATAALAAGSDDDTPPVSTETTTQCPEGQIYSTDAQACVDVEARGVTDDMRYDAVRELAYAGAYDRALTVLESAEDPEASRMLTYHGFIARKQGDQVAAETYYQAALTADPANILARSYYGQGLAAQGDLGGALAQLEEIAMLGGQDSWAHESLLRAISGTPSDY